MAFVIYSTSGCPQCIFTKKFLEREGIPFTEKRVDKDERYRAEVQQIGYQSLPLIQWDEDKYFAGYQPQKLEELVQEWQR